MTVQLSLFQCIEVWKCKAYAREYWRRKYHSTIDLLFDWFRLVCFADKKNCQLSYSWFQTSQTEGQQYSDTSPFSILSIRQIYFGAVTFTPDDTCIDTQNCLALVHVSKQRNRLMSRQKDRQMERRREGRHRERKRERENRETDRETDKIKRDWQREREGDKKQREWEREGDKNRDNEKRREAKNRENEKERETKTERMRKRT